MAVRRTLGSVAVVGLLVLLLAACEGSGGSGGFDAGGGGGGGDTGGAADVGGSPDVRADAAPGADSAGPADVPPGGDAPVDVGGPPDVPIDAPGIADLPPPADVPEPADLAPDVPPSPDVPVEPDVALSDVPPPPRNELTVDCAVPYILDGSRLQDLAYISEHFGHLIQQYCITGSYEGTDIASFPEKMYYGSHLPGDDVLTLTQISMQSLLEPPRFTVRVDFLPDSAVLPGSVWAVGLEDGNALGVLLGHPTQETVCLRALATGGSLTFGAVTDATLPEGGAFVVAGTLDLTPAVEVEDACAIFAESGLPCCD